MAGDIQIPCANLGTLLGRFRAAGQEEAGLLAHLGLCADDLPEPVAPIALHLFARAADHGAATYDDPLFAAHAALFTDGTEYDWARYLVLSQPDVRTMLREAMGLWKHIVNPFTPTVFEDADGGGVRLSTGFALSPALHVYAEFQLALILRAVVNGLGRPVAPVGVALAHAPRAAREVYQAAFGGAVRFDAGEYAIGFPREVLSERFLSANEHLARLARVELQRQAQAHYVEGMDLPGLIRATLHQAETTDDWRLESVAAALRLPPRTLQHKLQQAGTSFQLLADTARKARAVNYLDAGLGQEEVSYRLGYADVGSFRKAFRRWYAAPPGEWRRAREPLPAGADGGGAG